MAQKNKQLRQTYTVRNSFSLLYSVLYGVALRYSSPYYSSQYFTACQCTLLNDSVLFKLHLINYNEDAASNVVSNVASCSKVLQTFFRSPGLSHNFLLAAAVYSSTVVYSF